MGPIGFDATSALQRLVFCIVQYKRNKSDCLLWSPPMLFSSLSSHRFEKVINFSTRLAPSANPPTFVHILCGRVTPQMCRNSANSKGLSKIRLYCFRHACRSNGLSWYFSFLDGNNELLQGKKNGRTLTNPAERVLVWGDERRFTVHAFHAR